MSRTLALTKTNLGRFSTMMIGLSAVVSSRMWDGSFVQLTVSYSFRRIPITTLAFASPERCTITGHKRDQSRFHFQKNERMYSFARHGRSNLDSEEPFPCTTWIGVFLETSLGIHSSF